MSGWFGNREPDAVLCGEQCLPPSLVRYILCPHAQPGQVVCSYLAWSGLGILRFVWNLLEKSHWGETGIGFQGTMCHTVELGTLKDLELVAAGKQ